MLPKRMFCGLFKLDDDVLIFDYISGDANRSY